MTTKQNFYAGVNELPPHFANEHYAVYDSCNEIPFVQFANIFRGKDYRSLVITGEASQYKLAQLAGIILSSFYEEKGEMSKAQLLAQTLTDAAALLLRIRIISTIVLSIEQYLIAFDGRTTPPNRSIHLLQKGLNDLNLQIDIVSGRMKDALEEIYEDGYKCLQLHIEKQQEISRALTDFNIPDSLYSEWLAKAKESKGPQVNISSLTAGEMARMLSAQAN